MLRHYLTPTLTLAGAAEPGLQRLQPPRFRRQGCALADSAAVYEKESGMFRKVGETPNLQGPESARYDRDLDVWFVANINGTPPRRTTTDTSAGSGLTEPRTRSSSSRAGRRASP